MRLEASGMRHLDDPLLIGPESQRIQGECRRLEFVQRVEKLPEVEL